MIEMIRPEIHDLVVKRDRGPYKSKSFALWKVLHVYTEALETVALSKKGAVVAATRGVYGTAMFDHATPEEIKAGRRLK